MMDGNWIDNFYNDICIIAWTIFPMINCVIIDDEKLARDSLELMFSRYFQEKVNVVAKADSLKEGVFAIYKHNPDLVFLDIEMPVENDLPGAGD